MIEIIPAIDVMNGRCVRLSQGNFAEPFVYDYDPCEAAIRFEDAGLRRLHMVDLDGARTGKIANLRVLENVAKAVDMVIDFGGGIKTDNDLESVFSAGASIANIGSLAIHNRMMLESFIETYGPQKFFLGADVRNEMLAADGWKTATDIRVIPFLSEWNRLGVGTVFVTDISKDGVLTGPSIELYKKIIDALPGLRLIASGGVRSIDDINELDDLGCQGVIVGKAFYEGHIKLSQLSGF